MSYLWLKFHYSIVWIGLCWKLLRYVCTRVRICWIINFEEILCLKVFFEYFFNCVMFATVSNSYFESFDYALVQFLVRGINWILVWLLNFLTRVLIILLLYRQLHYNTQWIFQGVSFNFELCAHNVLGARLSIWLANSVIRASHGSKLNSLFALLRLFVVSACW